MLRGKRVQQGLHLWARKISIIYYLLSIIYYLKSTVVKMVLSVRSAGLLFQAESVGASPEKSAPSVRRQKREITLAIVPVMC